MRFPNVAFLSLAASTINVACVSTQGRTSGLLHAPEEIGPVSYAHCFSSEEAFHAVGGFNHNEKLTMLNSRGVSYAIKKDQWLTWPTRNAPFPKTNFAAAELGLNLYVFGGEEQALPFTNNLYAFNIQTEEWTALSKSDPVKARRGASLVSIDSTLIIFGGKTADHANNWGTYNTINGAWRHYNNYKAERSSHIALPAGKKVFVWGGFEDRDLTDGGLLLDPTQGTVEKISASPLLNARANARAVSEGDKIYIMGGASERGAEIDGAIYDLKRNIWTKIPAMPGARDHKDFEIAMIADRGLLVFGGRSKAGAFIEESYLLDLASLSWKALRIPGAPSPRIAHCMNTLSGNLLIFGGLSRFSSDSPQMLSDELAIIPFSAIPK